MDDKKKQGLEAARILNSELFLTVCAELDDDYVAAWRNAKTPEERERSWYRQTALAEIKNQLFSRLQNAALAERGKDEELNAALSVAKEKKCRKSQKKA